mgnify:CR=1 FL=1
MEPEYVVRFSSHPRPFRVRDTYCNNPDCPCRDVFLTLREVSDTGHSLKDPLSFSVHVDVDTWEEREPPERPAKVTAWVREFLNQCPAARRAEFKARYEEGKRIARRKAEYLLDAEEVLDGALVSYAHILSGKSPLSAGGNAYTFDVRYQGREFLVEDRYCPNPHCDCQAVHLEFFEAVSPLNGKPRIYQRFLGRVTFAGQLTVEKRFKGIRSEANAVLSAWWKQYSQELKMLAGRYQDVKEIGQRSLDAPPSHGLAAQSTAASPFARDMLLDHPPAANVKVGRNAACPCGSGKKYKKCCGRKSVLAS